MRTPKLQNKSVEKNYINLQQYKINIKIKILSKIAIMEDQKEGSIK